MATNETGDLTTRVLVEIRDELKTHRSQLAAIHDELKDHRGQLAGIHDELRNHRGQLAAIHDELKDHRVQLVDIRAELRGQGSTLTQVLRAIEHGNAQRDERVVDLESRVSRIEARIGPQP